MHEFEEKIRHRAYELWERGGGAGDADGHWYAAEEEIRAELSRALDVEVTAAAPPRKAPRRAKAAEAAKAEAVAPKRRTKARTPAS
jgi:hypothetical protein